jgi:hypothetical protein
MEPPMSARLAVLSAVIAAAVGGLAWSLRGRPVRDLSASARRFGRAAARNVADDWDALFI